MGATPTFALPYPEPTDPADVPLDMRELAERIETVLLAQTAPAMVKIAEQTLGAAAASIDFASIPQTYAHLRLVVLGRSTIGALQDALGLRFNGDAGATYDLQDLTGRAAAASAGQGAATTYIGVGILAGASESSDYYGQADILIPNYRVTPLRKTAVGTSGKASPTAGELWVRAAGGAWRTPSAAINRVTVIAAGGNFSAGSRATLYGLT